MTAPYEKWECFKRGMYKTACADWQEKMLLCADLLRSDGFFDSATHVAESWVNSAAEHLPKTSATYRPWLGHAACALEFGVPNWVTKKAWHLLSADEQQKANAIADSVRVNWIKEQGLDNGQDLLV